jgi:hypothetical protein
MSAVDLGIGNGAEGVPTASLDGMWLVTARMLFVSKYVLLYVGHKIRLLLGRRLSIVHLNSGPYMIVVEVVRHVDQ